MDIADRKKVAGMVTLRDFPYPYKAFLAICSDLDETPGETSYFETARFLNTTAETQMGRGVGLEVGNTVYFDMPPGHFSYWNSSEAAREQLCELMRSGHIDCLHSIGDTATAREQAVKAFNELESRRCKLKVWIDHAVAPTNLGMDIMKGGGDKPGHPAFHSDLLVQYGITYVWRGRVTSLIGQEIPIRYGGIWNLHHPLRSTKTVAKTLIKQGLAVVRPKGKYALHRGNNLLKPVRLNCGKTVFEFMRSNPHWGGVSSCDTGRGIGEVLTRRFLETLIERRASTILYTHLGKLTHTSQGAVFPPAANKAFRLLAAFKQRGEVLVSTTRRLLDYHRVKKDLSWSVHEFNASRVIAIESGECPSQLQGLTFYVEPGKNNQVTLNDQPLKTISNPPDETGKESISIPWIPLQYPV